MKICIINNLYPPFARGGAEQVVKKTVENLLEKGHEVVLISGSPQGEYSERKEKLKIYRIKQKNIFYYTDAHKYNIFLRFIWHIFDIFNFSVKNKIKSILIKESPDVVHTHNLMGLSFLLPKMIQEMHLRHVHTVHDVQLAEPSGIILKNKEKTWRYTGWPTKIYIFIMRRLFASPEVVISPSTFLLDFYKSRGFFPNSKFALLRNPLTVDFEIKEKKPLQNTSATLGEEKINFLYLGQIEEHKGIFLLLEAFASLDKKIQENIRLYVAGIGSKFLTVKEKYRQDNILFLGKIKRNELANLFSNIDVMIVPSLCYENSPTVIFESLYAKIPVLASNIEGIAELIAEGENGITFVAGDIKNLQEKIIYLVKNKEKITEMHNRISSILQDDGIYISKLEEIYKK
ncbi:MAG: glycosyltransferase family 4 protein [Patescibacteria group bacterium]